MYEVPFFGRWRSSSVARDGFGAARRLDAMRAGGAGERSELGMHANTRTILFASSVPSVSKLIGECEGQQSIACGLPPFVGFPVRPAPPCPGRVRCRRFSNETIAIQTE